MQDSMTAPSYGATVDLTVTVEGAFRALTVGDLHLSDKHSNRHKNYFNSCVAHVNDITDLMVKEKITHLFLTGDIVGRTNADKNMQTREGFLYLLTLFKKWNELTNWNVYSNWGNHDSGANLTDFSMLHSLGYIKTPSYVDFGNTRVHLLNFGETTRPIEFDADRYNVAITHGNLQIANKTTWFRAGEGIEVSTLNNLYGVEFIIGGDIHTPSPHVVETAIKDKTVSLIYPGNGTRPAYDAHIWNQCFGVIITSSESDGTTVALHTFELEKPEDFYNLVVGEDAMLEEEENTESSPAFSIDELSNILAELTNYSLLDNMDYSDKVRKMGGLDDEATELALEYIKEAERELK